MRTIIAGSRTLLYSDLLDALAANPDLRISTVVSGGATGIDLAGEQWARRHTTPYEIYPANWKKYGNGAGFIRNERMTEVADALLAVWDGRSRGTKHMIEIMKKLNKPVYVYIPERFFSEID